MGLLIRRGETVLQIFCPYRDMAIYSKVFFTFSPIKTKYLEHGHNFDIERKIHNNSKFLTQTLLNNFFNSVFACDIFSFGSYILDLLFFTIHLPSIITYFTSLPDAE